MKRLKKSSTFVHKCNRCGDNIYSNETRWVSGRVHTHMKGQCKKPGELTFWRKLALGYYN